MTRETERQRMIRRGNHPHTCPECGKEMHPSHLARHRRTHGVDLREPEEQDSLFGDDPA